MSRKLTSLVCLVLGSVACSVSASAQGNEDLPPFITALQIDVYDDNGIFRFGRLWNVLDGFSVPQIGHEAGFPILEGFLLDVGITFRDPDLVKYTAATDTSPAKLERVDEDFFARKRSFPLFQGSATSFFFFGGLFEFAGGIPPNPPPLDLAFDTPDFVAPPFLFIPPLDLAGLTDPSVLNDVGFFAYAFDIPDFLGPSQSRLAGLQTWDVGYSVLIELTNTEAPADDDPRGVVGFSLFLRENPAFRPGNAPPFADAGANGLVTRDPATGLAIGVLDARASVDATNVGFDPADPQIFEKDALTYDWELYSYPSDWTPNYTIQPFGDGTARAIVELRGTRIGDVMEFRVVVRDGSNAAPSSAIVRITVSDSVQPNQAPVASGGPDLTVGVGGTITLSGALSSDPDGDTLTYLWRQTNAVGGALSDDQVATAFQPVSGLNTVQSTWRAVAIGTYYFRLIVADPLGDSDFEDVVVVVSETGGATARELGDTTNGGDLTPLVGTGLCGAGLAPVAIVPFALFPVRKRIR